MKKLHLSLLLLLIVPCAGAQTYGPVITDIDGNRYQTVVIGGQWWMAENLKTTSLRDGTVLPKVEDDAAWAALSTPAYCWYDNDSATYNAEYGILYNWHAVNTGNLCPEGWHVPSEDEWNALEDFLGGPGVAGGKLKEAGKLHRPGGIRLRQIKCFGVSKKKQVWTPGRG